MKQLRNLVNTLEAAAVRAEAGRLPTRKEWNQIRNIARIAKILGFYERGECTVCGKEHPAHSYDEFMTCLGSLLL